MNCLLVTGSDNSDHFWSVLRKEIQKENECAVCLVENVHAISEEGDESLCGPRNFLFFRWLSLPVRMWVHVISMVQSDFVSPGKGLIVTTTQ